jgi:hypothetical protein
MLVAVAEVLVVLAVIAVLSAASGSVNSTGQLRTAIDGLMRPFSVRQGLLLQIQDSNAMLMSDTCTLVT